MNMNHKINLALSLVCALGGLSYAAPAEAQNFKDVLRNVLNSTGSTNYNSNYDYNQNSNFSPPSAAQSQTMMNLDSRRMQLSAQISQAVGDGRMNSSQANNLQASLNSNSSLQNSYSNDGNFTFAEAQSCLNALSTIDASVQAAISVYPANTNANTYTTYSYSSGYGGYGDRFQRRSNDHGYSIDRLQSEVLNRLQSGRSDQRLTRSEYSGLKREYDSIASSEVQFRSHGGFSRQESSSLQMRLDSLNSSITQQLQNGNNRSARRNGSYSW